MQKHVNLVDLVKSFPTNIFLQNLASIQKRTSPVKFAHLAEKSEKGSVSNLSTKVQMEAAKQEASMRANVDKERNRVKKLEAHGLQHGLSASDMSTGLQIRALKFQSSSSKFPRARTCELVRARSRLYKFRRASPSARLWWNLSSQ